MNQLFISLGWMFLALALLFLLGLLHPFARHFYPKETGVVARAAAPFIFALLALTCFQGWGLPTLVFGVVAGMVSVSVTRRNRQMQTQREKTRV